MRTASASPSPQPIPPGETRKYVDNSTSVVHTVSKSQQRLARCRFMMLNLDPGRAPLPSKRLKLGRVGWLDHPELPIYGYSDETWQQLTVCKGCSHSILGSADRHNGASNFGVALRRQRERIRRGQAEASILCCECLVLAHSASLADTTALRVTLFLCCLPA
jgi:hypothetical protein